MPDVDAIVNELAAEREQVGIIAEMPEEAKAFIARVLEVNDSLPRSKRITQSRALDTLKEKFGVTIGRTTMQRYLTEVLRRRSWQTK